MFKRRLSVVDWSEPVRVLVESLKSAWVTYQRERHEVFLLIIDLDFGRFNTRQDVFYSQFSVMSPLFVCILNEV